VERFSAHTTCDTVNVSANKGGVIQDEALAYKRCLFFMEFVDKANAPRYLAISQHLCLAGNVI